MPRPLQSLKASIVAAAISISSCILSIITTRQQGALGLSVWQGARSMADPVKRAQGLLLAELEKSKADRNELQVKELREYLKLTQASGQYAGLISFECPDAEVLQIACGAIRMTSEGVVGGHLGHLGCVEHLHTS